MTILNCCFLACKFIDNDNICTKEEVTFECEETPERDVSYCKDFKGAWEGEDG